jgi:hypothetical protein
MKKFVICMMMACLSLTILPLSLNAAAAPTSIVGTRGNESAEIKTLELRLIELKEMDKSKMNSAEKKSMRKEVKSINRRMHDISGGLYISGGAIIIILLLLLIL